MFDIWWLGGTGVPNKGESILGPTGAVAQTHLFFFFSFSDVIYKVFSSNPVYLHSSLLSKKKKYLH